MPFTTLKRNLVHYWVVLVYDSLFTFSFTSVLSGFGSKKYLVFHYTSFPPNILLHHISCQNMFMKESNKKKSPEITLQYLTTDTPVDSNEVNRDQGQIPTL